MVHRDSLWKGVIDSYVSFEQSDFRHKFQKEVLSITKTRESMGIREAILEDLKAQFREEAMREGMEKGMEKGRKELTQQIIARAHRRQLPIEDIVLLVDLPVDEVEAIIESLEA